MLASMLCAFLFRLAGGLAVAMVFTPPRDVVSGFYRVHLWVLLGLFTLAAAVASGQGSSAALTAGVVGAVLSYFGSVVWLYEKARWGRWMLGLVAACGMTATVALLPEARLTMVLDALAGSLVLGFTMCAMFLGHWYLNTPTMKLDPLKRLVLAMAVAVALRAAISAGILVETQSLPTTPFTWWLVGLRWLAGVVGLAIISLMTWQTLKIPNTQSATGILYVGVIFAFLSEVSAQLPWSPMA